jgi:hypothetical protein
MDYKSLKAEFEQLDILSQLASRKSSHAPLPWMAEAARLWENQYCLAKGIAETPSQTMRYMNHREDLHNCPVCASQCFHSDLYQLGWVFKCPLHQTKIVTLCPSCNLPWPKPSELLSRRCSRCSARLSPVDLIASGTFRQSFDTQAFDQVARAIQTYYHTPTVSLSAKLAGDYQYRDHHSVGPYSKAWPSLAAHGDLNLTAAFQAFGASVTPVCEAVFQLKVRSTEYLSSSSHEYWQELVLRQFRRCLIAQLQHRFGHIGVSDVTFPRFNSLHSPALIDDLCRTVWRKILAGNSEAQKRFLKWNDQTIEKITGAPLVPCFMTSIVRESERGSEAGFQQENRLPRTIQVWLFRCDIWWSFATLLRSIDALTAELAREERPKVPFNSFERRRWHDPRYLVSLKGGEAEQLIVRVPNWVSRVSLEDLDLQVLRAS